MSQTSFLEDIIQWDESRCRLEVDSTLPRLLSLLLESQDLTKEIGLLKIVCHTFVPCVLVHNLEEKVTSKISVTVCSIFDEALKLTISAATRGSCRSGENDEALHITTSMLQVLVEVLDCVGACIRQLRGSATPLPAPQAVSIPGITLHVLKGAYSHCQTSGDIYGDLVVPLAQHLTDVFKQAHRLQTEFLSLLEKMDFSLQKVDDLPVTVCEGLFELLKIVTVMDVKIAITIWKSLSRLSTENKGILCGKLDVDGMISHLSKDLRDGCFNLIDQVSSTIDKRVKLLGFQLKILIVFVRGYEGYLHDCVIHLHKLLLELLRFSPPCLDPMEVSQHVAHILSTHLVNGVDTLLARLLSSDIFMQLTINQSNDERPLLIIMLLLRILMLLPKASPMVMDQWMSVGHPESKLLDTVFNTAVLCHMHLSLPETMTCESSEKGPQSSLYQHICTILCGCMASMPARHFQLVEHALLRNILLGKQCCHSLASDIWCFIARYGSADLCQDHIHGLLDLLRSLQNDDSEIYHRLLSIIQRLCKFAAPVHLTQLLEKSPVELLCRVIRPGFNGSIDTIDCSLDRTLSFCAHTMSRCQKTGHISRDNIKQLIVCLNHLSYVYDHCHEKRNSWRESNLVSETVIRFWQSIPQKVNSRQSDVDHLIVAMINLTSKLLIECPAPDIIQVLKVLEDLLINSANQAVALSIINLLKQMRSIQTENVYRGEMSRLLTSLFGNLLTSSHCLVHHHAASAFSVFAEETDLETVVQTCLEMCSPSMQTTVIDFINKDPYRNDLFGSTITKDYLLQQVDTWKAALSGDWIQQIADQENVVVQSNVDDVVNVIKIKLEIVRMSKAQGSLPESAIQILKEVQEDIANILSDDS